MPSESDISPATQKWIEAAAKDATRQIEQLVREVTMGKTEQKPAGSPAECLQRALEAADYMAKVLDEMFRDDIMAANECPDLYRAMCGYERFVEAYRRGGLQWETR